MPDHRVATVPGAPDLAARAAHRIPGGSSTGSKRPAALYGTDDAHAPTHYRSASGCRVVTADGTTITDFTMSLGAVALGYADPAVTEAVQRAARDGNVSGLPHVRELEIAERLCEVIPCAEQVRFLKSGAEGVAAAVRIARAATGRDLVIGCGYFGWLGWWTTAAGVPAGVSADFVPVPFDDVPALEQAVADAGDRLAAIVLEPVVERLPSVEWARTARALCDDRGAVLVFDEVKTGFRLAAGGYQAQSGIAPHLAVVGKALANGYPLAAVVGVRRVMTAVTRTWISSTLAGESTALAAAGAVLDRHSAQDVCATLRDAGERQMRVVRAELERAGRRDLQLQGIAPMWFLHADHARTETSLLLGLVRRGVLLKRGAYDFPSLAHDDEALAQLAGTLRDTLAELPDPESLTP